MKKKSYSPLLFSKNEPLILIGRKAIQDFLSNLVLQKTVQKIVLASSQQHLINQLKQQKLNHEIASKKWFDQKFKNLNHQYCCVYLHAYNHSSLEQLIIKCANEETSLILMLDQIQDPHNFGAILRTAAAAKVSGVIVLNKNQAKLNTTVLKVSAGTGLLVNIVEVNNLNTALEKLKQAGFWSYASMLDKNAKHYREVDYDKKSVLIIGNEGDGISHHLGLKSDFKIIIPMASEVDSLNVSVAAGILTYAIKNQHS